MCQLEKLKRKLFTQPSCFAWVELCKLLRALGYHETNAGKTSDSRIRFLHDQHAPICLHKPHPKPILKRYQLKQIINALYDRDQL